MNRRGLHIRIFIVAVAVILISQLFNVQVVNDSYKQSASNNAIRKNVQFPQRGEIYDRNGLFLAQSDEAYDLVVIPRDIKNLDTLALCNLIDIDKTSFIKELKKVKRFSYHRPSVIFRQIPKEMKLRLDEYNFSGFYTQYCTIRSYPYHTAGNILGYVGEVNDRMILADSYYRSGDYAGMTGIERAYEKVLRGEKGVKMVIVDVHGVPKGEYQEGSLDTLSEVGTSIVSTIDIELQLLCEKLLKGKVGSVVAIEPATGEILAMVSSPTYNPDNLIGRDRSDHFRSMLADKQKPFFNRAVMASYPPGSTFKMATALVALQEGVITPQSRFSCDHGYVYGDKKLGCHAHRSPLDMYYSIQTSCNAYYCNVYRAILENDKYEGPKVAFEKWREMMLSFGFGRKLDSDFIGELNGNLPTSAHYNKVYRGRWNALTTLSLSIGQGEIGVTPLQLANFISTIANRGHYYIPHVIKSVGDKGKVNEQFYTKKYTDIDSKHFESVIEGMWRAANEEGTSLRSYIPGMDVCGKTGTAENPHGKDHSTFAAFAPRINPKIAISVYVEKGGFGSTVALPIAKIAMEQYLLGEVKSVDLMERIVNMEIKY